MSKSIDKLQKELEAIQGELQDLERFRDTKTLRRFKRILHGDLSTTKEKIKKLTETQKERDERRKQRLETANRNRSSKNRRVWKYVKSIKENYHPELSLKEIRSQLKRHRQGLETEVSGVAWRNPSP